MWGTFRYGQILDVEKFEIWGNTHREREGHNHQRSGRGLSGQSIWGVNPSNYMGRKPLKLYGVITPPQTDQKVGGGSAQQGGLLFFIKVLCKAPGPNPQILQTDQKSGGGPAQEGGSRQQLAGLDGVGPSTPNVGSMDAQHIRLWTLGCSSLKLPLKTSSGRF